MAGSAKAEGSQGSGTGDQDNEAEANYADNYEDEEEGYEEEGAAEAEAAEEEAAAMAEVATGIYNAMDVNDQVFEELRLGEEAVREVQACWEAFLRTGTSRDAAGEALYAAVFDAAPMLQSLFKTPRAVMAMRFINGLNQIIMSLNDPAANKIVVETLGFQHLELEVTVPRTVIFRDAITDLLAVETGPLLTTRARMGFMTVLNYVGGAYIYIRVKYTERLKIISASWATANNRKLDENGEEALATAASMDNEGEKKLSDDGPKKESRRFMNFGGSAKKGNNHNAHDNNNSGEREDGGRAGMHNLSRTAIPTTYNEMFMFNAAVMGFGDRPWMSEVLVSFDTIVHNVSNTGRLQEECDVLALRISKLKGVTVALSEYKAVMLASLRSLVPKDWGSSHEVSWSWLWENVERMINANLGKPVNQERALSKLLAGLDEKTRGAIRRNVYSTFFEMAPAGQEYFKQSTTRLHFIADRIVAMTLEMYRDPVKMVEDISALGLRHVGYGIPTELFGPFVTACVQVVRSFSEDPLAEEAFRWSLSLVSRILVRVISEGSTIVMKAINLNSTKQLVKAISCAPRGKRAMWMLNVQVGTQSISPLVWAIRTGSHEAAKAIIVDLLTIRADRDRYYYGMDAMFERHPDIIETLVQDAPALLKTLFDGLIWRSRTAEGGLRRVNYYVRHLLVDSDGGFAKTIEWITENGDPKIVCHPVIAMVTDVVWSRVAFRAFLYGKAWVILTLVIFTVGVAVFDEDSPSEANRIVIFACRAFTYIFSLLPKVYWHVTHACKDFRNRNTVKVLQIPIPAYLARWQDVVNLILTLFLTLMLGFEPIVSCLANPDGDFQGSGLFTQVCPSGQDVLFTYSALSICCVFLYFLLTIDLSAFSTRLSAFVLICFTVMSEVWLYLFGLLFVTLAFSCGTSALRHSSEHFDSIPTAALSLVQVAFAMFDKANYEQLRDDPVLLTTVAIYVIVSITFLANLLIAQMNCAYSGVYEDMVGYARLNRGKIVTECMPSVPKARWQRFTATLRLDEPCEFGEGDMGLPGAVQMMEPASLNITTVEMIRRFGGSTSISAQWPEDDHNAEDGDDRFAQMEKMLDKAIRKMGSKRGKGKTTSTEGSKLSGESAGHSVSDTGSQAGEEA